MKLALVAELPAGGVIVSYDFLKFTPYLSGRVSLTKYENPVGYYWRTGTNQGTPYRYYESQEEKNKVALLPSIGCEVRIIANTRLVVEGGVIPDYYRKDDLYVIGLGVIF